MRALALLLVLLSLACGQQSSPKAVQTYTFRVVHTFPHDPQAFTQGLIFHDGFLYEGTGLEGRSELRKVELQSGKVVQRKALGPQYFGEGITLLDGHLYQLTWKNQVGFIYDPQTFALQRTWNYTTEGWGLTHDGKQLILSDGSAKLYFLDPKTLKVERTLLVTLNGQPLPMLNELEYVKGKIYANVWQTPQIVIIDPQNGRVEGVVDLTNLVLLNPGADVLNGIAYDPATDRLFVTGKLWPRLFEIELVPSNR
ncbi:glutaminyl-peptide cyclotransferase [Meiothermus sp. PNK-Is4]|nr:glutaminyl-peptide cyclotransferase [Meiothermus sp. PNK-Is4]PZA06537.1 glutaminyl-peptide cyclotransferase [Meiothermus sp. Pnk-1]RYM37213.1 glutaminyl-peptide cyclotransferase [Meiothermus sp. PNK-Is4]